jgi:hypothetical protein
MCCFSGAVQSVTGTRIFARHTGRGRQALAYAMSLSADQDVAMVLPLPVARPLLGGPDLHFIDLSEYADFFEDLQKGYPPPAAFGLDLMVSGAAPPQLAVHVVGAFEASFVPSLSDFGRLDPRFRLPEGIWDALPTYRDWGFAVFKLRAGQRQEIHPMAFEFDTRDRKRLYFPTVHVHDGAFHPEADFAHTLYCQGDADLPAFWRTPGPARDFVDVPRAKGLVDGDLHVDMRSIFGRQPNADVWA